MAGHCAAFSGQQAISMSFAALKNQGATGHTGGKVQMPESSACVAQVWTQVHPKDRSSSDHFSEMY